jgi:hypothetical protein
MSAVYSVMQMDSLGRHCEINIKLFNCESDGTRKYHCLVIFNSFNNSFNAKVMVLIHTTVL